VVAVVGLDVAGVPVHVVEEVLAELVVLLLVGPVAPVLAELAELVAAVAVLVKAKDNALRGRDKDKDKDKGVVKVKANKLVSKVVSKVVKANKLVEHAVKAEVVVVAAAAAVVAVVAAAPAPTPTLVSNWWLVDKRSTTTLPANTTLKTPFCDGSVLPTMCVPRMLRLTATALRLSLGATGLSSEMVPILSTMRTGLEATLPAWL